MILGLPEVERVLILTPHPDDEALGCAGTVTLLNRKGVSSTVVFLTDGERLNGAPSQEVAAIRRTEGLRSSDILGCKEPVFLGLPDGEVEDHTEEGCRKLSDIIAAEKPDLILSPSPMDYHQDHLAAADIALKLLEYHRSFKLAFYEVYSTVRFTHFVDISEAVEQKKKAILNYRTSLYGKPEIYVHASLGLNAHRSLFLQKKGYYEAFWIIDRPLTREEMTEWLAFGFTKG